MQDKKLWNLKLFPTEETCLGSEENSEEEAQPGEVYPCRDLGVGKTVLHGIAQGLGIEEPICSRHLPLYMKRADAVLSF